MVTNSKTAILVVGPSWVGDLVMAQSLFKVLHRESTGVHLDVLAPTWSEGLLKRMPEVRHFIPLALTHGQWGWRERLQLGRQLREGHYQQAIVLPNSWKSALIPFWAKIPQRTGYVGEMRYGLLNDIRRLNRWELPKTVEQFAALGLPADDPRRGKLIPQPLLSPGNPELILRRLNLSFPTQPVLALCPGAEYGPAKQWPLEYYAQVATQKLAEGWQVWILGSPKDTATGARIAYLAGNGSFNLCGQTSLSEAVDLMALAQVVVSNDSGLMHVAAALGKSLIALYGSSDPRQTPPLKMDAQILYLGLKCSPCFQRTCPLQHLKCLREITPAQVLEKFR